MPDQGERPAVEIERNLESASYANLPSLDCGLALLESLPAHHISGGRKLKHGIIIPNNYTSPIVNIRPPKWADSVFWIKAKTYAHAKYIVDAVNYHIGREPFYFLDANFQYPPLCLGTSALLTTREMCSAYVTKIAKEPALKNKRQDYRERVKELVLNAVESPEAVQFLRSLHAGAPSVTNFEAIEDGVIAPDGEEAANNNDESFSAVVPPLEIAVNNNDDDSGEHATPMEVDNLSEQAILLLVPLSSGAFETVDPASVFRVAETDTNFVCDFDLSTAFVPSFGMDLDGSGIVLCSEGRSLRGGCSRLSEKTEDHTTPSNLEGLLRSLDGDEEKCLSATESSKWDTWRPRPDTWNYALRF